MLVDNSSNVSEIYYSFSSLADIYYKDDGVNFNTYVDNIVRQAVPNVGKQRDYFEKSNKLYSKITQNTALKNMKWIKIRNQQKYISQRHGALELSTVADRYVNINGKDMKYEPAQRMFSCCERKIISEFYPNVNGQLNQIKNLSKIYIYTSKPTCSICYKVLVDFTYNNTAEIAIIDNTMGLIDIKRYYTSYDKALSKLRDRFDTEY